MITTCQNCGDQFDAANKYRIPKYCSQACQREAQKRINAWKRKLKSKEEEEEHLKKMTLAEAQEEAKKAGLSYGHYYAMQAAKNIKIQRRRTHANQSKH